jgi:hypothetical protein
VKVSGKARYLVGLIVAYIIADFLLTPLGGIETRDVSKVSSIGVATLGLLFTGLALNVICLILLLRNYRRAPIFGVVGSLLYFPAPVAEATGQFSSLSPPTGIAVIEVIEAIIAIAIIITGALVLREKPEAQMKPA